MWLEHTFNLALGSLGQVDLCETEASLVYTANSRLAEATENPCLKTKQNSFKKRKQSNVWSRSVAIQRWKSLTGTTAKSVACIAERSNLCLPGTRILKILMAESEDNR